jgi:hypothetical protein
MEPTPPPPASTDLEGWRAAICRGLLPGFRFEAIVAVLQDLGPNADAAVRNALAKHLSIAMARLLRKRVGLNHPNSGDDIIYRVSSQLFDALLDPQSADGRALREAFSARVTFRIKDAIVKERRHSRVPVEVKITTPVKARKVEEIVRTAPATAVADAANDTDQSDHAPPSNSNRDLSLLNGMRDLDQSIDIARLLAVVDDDRKRLAFYLHMDGVPFGSSRGFSIAQALGVSSRTAREWVKEVQTLLQSNPEIQELQKTSVGDRT